MDQRLLKDKIRQKIKLLKKEYELQQLNLKSGEVFSILEITGVFQHAKKIFIYNSLKDEVSTKAFIEKWKHDKIFYLPVVIGNDLVFREYSDRSEYQISGLGIQEPDGTDFSQYDEVDLVIIPGVAFDRNKNRLGRGKGFYDRFLPNIGAPKIGICFDFQLLDSIPCEKNDIKMDMIISENDLIW